MTAYRGRAPIHRPLTVNVAPYVAAFVAALALAAAVEVSTLLPYLLNR